MLRRTCQISWRTKSSHRYGFTSCFPLTSVHLRGHLTWKELTNTVFLFCEMYLKTVHGCLLCKLHFEHWNSFPDNFALSTWSTAGAPQGPLSTWTATHLLFLEYMITNNEIWVLCHIIKTQKLTNLIQHSQFWNAISAKPVRKSSTSFMKPMVLYHTHMIPPVDRILSFTNLIRTITSTTF